MGGKKKKKIESLGRMLIKDRFGNTANKKTMSHTADLQREQDGNNTNISSVTEQTEIDDVLSTAELAGTNFKAEKFYLKLVTPISVPGVLTNEEKSRIKTIQQENKSFLRIPRRPKWDRSMSAEELSDAEKQSFYDWRKDLALLEEKEDIVLTPFEKNLEFWRQLWRVIERSDVVLQIVDARNPLLYYCEDLTNYVKEIDNKKENLLLVNKADFLTRDEREKWAIYFREANINAIFFSAISEISLLKNDFTPCSDLSSIPDMNMESNMNRLSILRDEFPNEESIAVSTSESHRISPSLSKSISESLSKWINTSDVLSREQLIEVFMNIHLNTERNSQYVTIGFVGYPNVGKSTTINSLLQEKRVSVSVTPGKTKHFQTLFLTDNILLCDCPGLVFPAFVVTKEEMIISGILPVDQMRDHVSPMNLILSQIPRHVLETKYGVSIPSPMKGENPDRNPTSEEFLTIYGYMRGFMTQRGIPDHPRSARYVLKDYISGRLLYCHSPPNLRQKDYHVFPVEEMRKTPRQLTSQQLSYLSQNQLAAAIDAEFFGSTMPSKSHRKTSP